MRACKIAVADGVGCFTPQHDRVVTIDRDSVSSSSHDEDDNFDSKASEDGIEMT